MSDAELRRWRFDRFDPEQCTAANGVDNKTAIKATRHYKAVCEEYAQEPRGWLVLQGGTGVGKTYLAYAIAAWALGRGKGVFAHSVSEMLRGSYNDNSYSAWTRELRETDLLVLDDLGAQRETEQAQEQLYEIIDRRYAMQRPLVIATNYNLESEDCPIKKRILSRLRDGNRVKGGYGAGGEIPGAGLPADEEDGVKEKEDAKQTAGKPWRCDKCGSTIAVIKKGECAVTGKVTLGTGYTLVECPVCKNKNKWYQIVPV